VKGFLSSLLFSRCKIILHNKQVKIFALVSWLSAGKDFFPPESSNHRGLFALPGRGGQRDLSSAKFLAELAPCLSEGYVL
jgi:hypothetical protein